METLAELTSRMMGVLDSSTVVPEIRDEPFIVVGIPVYNEDKAIGRVVQSACKYADSVVVCDDGSTDSTAEIAAATGADVVKHNKNLGYGAAIKTLIKRAIDLQADILITLDGDGQHNPDEIPNLVKPLTHGNSDIVIGSRFKDSDTTIIPLYRRFGIKMITKLVNASIKNGVGDAQSGFRAYNRKAMQTLNLNESGMGASVEILFKASRFKLKISEVPASCSYDEDLDTSTENPITHGLGVIGSILRLNIRENLLPFLGSSAMICLLGGSILVVWLLET